MPLAAILLIAQIGAGAVGPSNGRVLRAYDAWEKCVLEQSFLAARSTPDDKEAVRLGASGCRERARAFARLHIKRPWVRFARAGMTVEERVQAVIDQMGPTFEAKALKHLPEARRTGITKVKLRH
jgi:hypothetical protein